MLNHPSRLLWIAAGLMILGVILPFLMVLNLIESTFFLNFLAYGAQTLGFILGLIGVAFWRRAEKHKDKQKDEH
jgi:hypothetical protein